MSAPPSRASAAAKRGAAKPAPRTKKTAPGVPPGGRYEGVGGLGGTRDFAAIQLKKRPRIRHINHDASWPVSDVGVGGPSLANGILPPDRHLFGLILDVGFAAL